MNSYSPRVTTASISGRSSTCSRYSAEFGLRCRQVLSTVILALTISISGCRCSPNSSGNGEPSADYSTLVTTFTIGTVALQSGDQRAAVGDKVGRDRLFLTKFTQLAPDEPAGWANLGLLELRSNNLSAASTDMSKAEKIAPNNAGIEKLLSLLADRQGDLAGSIAHGKEAVRLAPDDLRAVFALAGEYSRLNSPQGDSDYQAELQAIIDKQPTNLYAALDLAAIAAKRSDAPALQKAMALITVHSGGFDSRSKEYLNILSKAGAGKDCTRD